MILNGQKGFNMYKMVKNGKKLPKKWSKMVENGPNGRKWSKWSKMVKNGGPDLKQAQRTGLSARRARRTKSRGPKGLQLEVGARRAPRLLVYNNIAKKRYKPWCIQLDICKKSLMNDASEQV